MKTTNLYYQEIHLPRANMKDKSNLPEFIKAQVISISRTKYLVCNDHFKEPLKLKPLVKKQNGLKSGKIYKLLNIRYHD